MTAELDEAEPPTQSASLSPLGQWAQDARSAKAIALSLAQTSFVPKEMQGRPDLVTAAILTGQELGIDPMASLRSIDIIQGVPAMRANALRGMVQAAGHEVWTDDDCTETRAIVYGRRKGSEHVQRSTWTLDRAKNLGIAGRDNYKKQPGAMLVARATAEVCRLIASDVLLGMPYAVEELDGSDSGDSSDSKAKASKPAARKRTAQRKPLPDPETPPLEEPDKPEPEPQQDVPAEEPAPEPDVDPSVPTTTEETSA